MKKILAMALAAIMAVSMAACGGKAPAKYKVGMGISVSPKLTDAKEDKAGSVQMNTTMLVAAFDAEGKVVSVSIDVAQQSLGVNADGTTADPATTDLRTKVEKEGDYGMKGTSSIGKEYFEQLNALEDWMFGKTVAEITGMEKDESGHTLVEDLKAGCTIRLNDYLNALQEAWDASVEVEGLAKAGLGQNIGIKGTAAGDKEGSVQVDTNVVGAAFDAEGKILWAKIDVAQNKATFDATGKMQAAEEVDLRTKVEKEGDYGMAAASSIGKEYFEQVAALGQWMTGKTVDEVTAVERDEKGVPQAEDLKAGCTIKINSYLEALAEAQTNAK